MKIDALSAEIGGRGVLYDINLEVGPDDWLAIVGGSGAGKSTLLRAMIGLRRPAVPTAGTIDFDGTPYTVTGRGAARPGGMAFVPQSPAHGFDPLRRLRWQLAQLQRRLGARSDVAALLDTLALPDPGPRYPHQWSRGMQQRLLLAMALMGDPRLLLLDEPTSALDPVVAARVLQEVGRLAEQRGFAVVMVTHDLALAARYATRIAIMEGGRIVEAGPAAAVLTRPATPYARELVTHRHWHTAETQHVAV
ncbi:ABC transporter ATP-binding protein [Pontivivens ytuae]|uniref:ABC transporter ATP-binding protein n=1 Tax=Pontivivens ytuae TaxID=2789856 RepID=A0A7S9QEN2_9RHOB|nr:ABC transporter ATP-binding protein [Pontivivens ytuae]